MGQPNTSNLNESQGPLHPMLQSALGCLEVQLDDELTRYRRQRSAQPAANRPFKSQVRTKKKPGLDLISVKPASPNPAPADQSPQSAAPPYPTETAYTNGAANGSANHHYSSNGHSHNGHIHNGHAQNGYAQNGYAQNGHAHNGGQASAAGAIATLNPVNPAQSHRQGSAIASAPPAPAQANLVPLSPVDPDALNAAGTAEPQDYLESSEHLLQSLVEEAQTTTSSPKGSWTNQLFTPLGIGSMLLLLVSSIGLGYVIANPDALSNFSTRWQTDDDTSSTDSTDLNEPVTPSASKFDSSGQPNLSSEEFVELDLGTLSTLPSNAPVPSLPSPAPGLAADGSTTPTPLASPVTPPTSGAAGTSSAGTSSNSTASSASPNAAPSSSSSSSAPTVSSAPASRPSTAGASASSSSASRAAAPAPPAAPRPVAPTSTEQSAAPSRSSSSDADASQSDRSNSSSSAETASSSASSASSSSYYHVVVPYTGDQSLNEARRVANDAYIHNSSSGATIRLGAFADQSSAQEMVQNLQEQGLEADIED